MKMQVLFNNPMHDYLF